MPRLGKQTWAASKALSVKYGDPNGTSDQHEIPDEVQLPWPSLTDTLLQLGTMSTTIKTVEDPEKAALCTDYVRSQQAW
ncbi:hypothetical protein AC578_5409 [Pseudocercospora eumusae]|uniref:Uncharacterized protein n=1 Tax=Pseudocercospora eumusae TaxID=321146 RepID=A0A139HJV7_9PEZI|nr:hypothetical protein AC578_5409 [Pseudocercospora eumusae]